MVIVLIESIGKPSFLEKLESFRELLAEFMTSILLGHRRSTVVQASDVMIYNVTQSGNGVSVLLWVQVGGQPLAYTTVLQGISNGSSVLMQQLGATGIQAEQAYPGIGAQASGSSNSGTIAGAVVGTILGVALIAAVGYLIYRRRHTGAFSVSAHSRTLMEPSSSTLPSGGSSNSGGSGIGGSSGVGGGGGGEDDARATVEMDELVRSRTARAAPSTGKQFPRYRPEYYYAKIDASMDDAAFHESIGRGECLSDFSGVDRLPDADATLAPAADEGDTERDYALYQRRAASADDTVALYASPGSPPPPPQQQQQPAAEPRADAANPLAATLVSTDNTAFSELYARSGDVLNTKAYPRSWLRVEGTIGRGSFGDVLRARTSDGDVVAPYDVAVVLLHASAQPDVAAEFIGMAKLLCDLQHAHTVSLVGVCMPDLPWLVVLEYCPLGDLRSFLRACIACPAVDVQYADQCVLAHHIASGLAYLADRRIVHGNLAASTCLVATGTVVKIGGFRKARALGAGEEYVLAANTSSQFRLRWMAPESLEQRKFSLRSDVWSFGVLVWEIMSSGVLLPYRGVPSSKLLALLRSRQRLHQLTGCPDDLYGVMRQCWDEDEYARPTSEDLKEWFRLAVVRTMPLDASARRDMGAALQTARRQAPQQPATATAAPQPQPQPPGDLLQDEL